MKALKNNLFMLRYILKYVPFMAVGKFIGSVLSAAAEILFGTILTKYIVDSIQYERMFTSVLAFLGFIFIFGIINYAFQSWFNDKYYHHAKEILHEKMQTTLLKKAVDMDLSCYDSPKFYNDFIWATQEADTRAITVLETIASFINESLIFISLTTLAAMWAPFVFVFIAVSFIFSFRIGLRKNKKRYEYQKELKPKERKRDYINRIFYLPDYAKEIRLTDIKNIMLGKLHQNKDSMVKSAKRHGIKLWICDTITNIFGNVLMMDILAVIYLSYQVLVSKTISYGSFVALVNAVWNIKWSLQGVIRICSEFEENSLYIENFKSFINYEPKLIDNPSLPKVPKEPKELQLRNVSFTYDGNTEPTVKNINLTIKPHETIAIVGHNGAGKSTLIKVLMRLYDVTEGEILLNGKNIKEYSLKSYLENFGVVFQDFQIFAASIAENVKMDEVKKSDRTYIKESLESVGFSDKLNQLPKGIDTQLTKEFSEEGINLSGGEGQKVAIARTFMRDCSFVVLDEPSSALDPISEYNLNHSMLKAAKDKSVIVISHRLSSTRMADKIYVLDNGSIVGEGSHDELMSKNGIYAKMFKVQSEKYSKLI